MTVRVRWRPAAAALLAAIAVVATGLVAVPSAHALPNNTITGTVTDGDNDVPAAGLEVRLYREPGRVVVANRTTAADGTYAFAGIDDGSYRLRVADPVSGAFRTEFFADTYAYDQATPVDVAGGAALVRDMTVARPNAVVGTVTDEDSGLPVAGIEVRLYREPGRVVVGNRTTGADGSYRFDQPGPGSYRMRLRDPNGAYLTEHWADVAYYNQAAPITVAPGQTVTVDPQIGAPTQITGIVTDEATDAPIPGIEARLYREPGRVVVANATTDEDGAYAFTNPGAGTYRVRFSDPVGGRYTTEFWDDAATYPSGDDLVVGAGGSATASAGLARIDATYVVSMAADGADAAIDGVCEATPGAGDCTLRAAVDEANAHPAHDTVQIAAGIDPVLGLPGADEDDNATGDIDITTPVTIEGGGATIDAAGLDRGIDTHFADVVLRDLEVVGGVGDEEFLPAAGVRSFGGTLELVGVTLRPGSAPMQVSLVVLFVDRVSITDSTIEATGAEMAAALFGEHNEVERSMITMTSGPGAALAVGGLTSSIDASTIDGGPDGIALQVECCSDAGPSPNAVSISRSTLHAPGSPAISIFEGTVDLTASTVMGSPGIDNVDAVVTSRGSIVSSCAGVPIDSGGWNMAGGTCGMSSIGDQEGVEVLVGALGGHGGPTSTMLLYDNSPGVDAIPVGTPGLCSGSVTDQRGVSRPVGSGCDVGAVEGSSGMSLE